MSASVYAYGVVDAGAALELEPAGLGPVRVVESGDLAAVCSDVSGDLLGRRRELKAHADVLSAVCQEVAVVPFSFGTVLADDDEVRTRLLDRHAGHLSRELTRLRDVLQFNIRLVPDEQRLLADIVAASPDLNRLRRSVDSLPPGSGQAQRLRLGEAVAHAYRQAGEDIGAAVVNALAKNAVDMSVEEIGGPEATTRATMLVARRGVTSFLDEAQRVAEGLQGRVTCRVVGPLPPFSFVQPLDLAGQGPASEQPTERTWAS